MEALAPFLPVLARVRDRAADELGHKIPPHVARALALLRPNRPTQPVDAARLRAQLEDDPELQNRVADALGIALRGGTQINFNDQVVIRRGDFVAGDKHEHRQP